MKIKWILGIVLIFFLILATNLIDRQNFIIVKDSVETIYADRLLAQNIIYDITKIVGQKEVAYTKFVVNESGINITASNDSIAEHLQLFAATRLTPIEKTTFSLLQESVQSLTAVEASVAANQAPSERLFVALSDVRKRLDGLMQIQMQQGRRELFRSNKAIGSMELFTQIEVVSLIILAILIQVIILYTPKMSSDVQ